MGRDTYRSDRGAAAVRSWCERRLAAWSTPHERSELETAAGPTHLVAAGAGPGTVLLLPGTNGNAATSLALAAELAAHARVRVADVPGQPGLSTGRRPRHPAELGAWAGEVVRHVLRCGAGGPLVLVGHSLGAAVALAAPTDGVGALVLVDPAGLVRLRVPAPVLRSTLPWLARPTEDRSRALLQHMTAPGGAPSRASVEWMTLVARHTRTSLAPGPLPRAVTARWVATPRSVLSGEHDCFLPPARLRPAVRRHLGVELTLLRGLGHDAVGDDPAALASAVAAALPPAT